MIHRCLLPSNVATSRASSSRVLTLTIVSLVASAGILIFPSLSVITRPKGYNSAQLVRAPQRTRIDARFAPSMALIADQPGLITQEYIHLNGPTGSHLANARVSGRESHTLDFMVYSPTITVTSPSGRTGGPDCKLRDAITAANTDTSTGGCSAGSGDDIIVLPIGGNIVLTEVDNGGGTPEATGLPQITSKILIVGNGTTIVRQVWFGSLPFRIFRVAQTGVLTLNHVVVSGGRTADGAYGTMQDAGFGGGIYNAGMLILKDSTVSGNVTGIGDCGTGGDGGGIGNVGNLELYNSTVSGNATGNAVSKPQCVYLAGPFAGRGAGIFNQGNATVTNSTVASNTTGRSLSGFELYGSQGGAGITNSGILTLTQSTVSQNRIGPTDPRNPVVGGGIVNYWNKILSIQNTIVADNWSGDGNPDCFGTLTSSGYNLVGNNSGCTITMGLGDIIGTAGNPVNAQLLSLTDNGGPTWTMAFWPTSPARDRIPNAKGCGVSIATDQRGVPRPQPLGGLCDIGAFEYDRVDHFLPIIQKNQ